MRPIPRFRLPPRKVSSISTTPRSLEASGSDTHRIAKAMHHEPRGLILHLQHPVNLVGAHAFLRCRQQVEGEEPLGQGNVGVLEHGALSDGELALTGRGSAIDRGAWMITAA